MKVRCIDVDDLNDSFLELGKEYEVHNRGKYGEVHLVGNISVGYYGKRFEEIRAAAIKAGDRLRCVNMDHVDGNGLEIGKEYKVEKVVDELILVEGDTSWWLLYHFRPVVLYSHLTAPCNNCHYGLRLPTEFPCNKCNEVNGHMCYTLPRSDSPKSNEPSKGDFYFYTYNGAIRSEVWKDSEVDRYLLSINDVSKTLSEAEGKKLRRIIRARLEKFAEVNNEPGHARYAITYRSQGDKLVAVLLMNLYDTVSFSSQSIAERAIKEIEGLKEYYKYYA